MPALALSELPSTCILLDVDDDLNACNGSGIATSGPVRGTDAISTPCMEVVRIVLTCRPLHYPHQAFWFGFHEVHAVPIIGFMNVLCVRVTRQWHTATVATVKPQCMHYGLWLITWSTCSTANLKLFAHKDLYCKVRVTCLLLGDKLCLGTQTCLYMPLAATAVGVMGPSATTECMLM